MNIKCHRDGPLRLDDMPIVIRRLTWAERLRFFLQRLFRRRPLLTIKLRAVDDGATAAVEMLLAELESRRPVASALQPFDVGPRVPEGRFSQAGVSTPDAGGDPS